MRERGRPAEDSLCIDESGDPGRPTDGDGNRILRSTTHFGLAGIAADKRQKLFFERRHEEIMGDYFRDYSLPDNFKLHSNELRMGMWPYSDLPEYSSLKLEAEIYGAIRESESALFAFVINLEDYFRIYRPGLVSPLAYGMIRLLESYGRYERARGIPRSRVIYEGFTRSMDDAVYRGAEYLRGTGFRTEVDLRRLRGRICGRTPQQEPILQFADFWAYLPYRKEASSYALKSLRDQVFDYGVMGTDEYVDISRHEELS